MTADQVELLLGPAADQPTADVWVYWNYRAYDSNRSLRKFDTLLVFLEEGKVTDLRLVESSQVRSVIQPVKL